MAGTDDTWRPEAEGETVGPLEGAWAPGEEEAPSPERPEGIGRYLLRQGLGRGGMGEVVAAEDQALDREIALKILRRDGPNARRDFVGEARLTARLDHPGVVPVHDVGEMPDGRPFFAMKRVRGVSLAQALRARGLGTLRERLELFRRVAQTIAFAHDRGVLHLDIKPDNVMVGPYGEVLVMDWGLARNTSDGGAHLRQIAGTPRYMAPEQATAGARLDRRTDVYGLGALLYELVTGAAPYEGTELTRVLESVRSGATLLGPRQVDASVPRDVDLIVRKAMARSPDDRYDDVPKLLADVEATLDDRPLVGLATPPLQRLAKWSRRNRSAVRGFASAAGIGLLALTGGTVWWAGRLAVSERATREQLATAEVAVGDVLLRQGQPEDAADHYRVARRILTDLALDPSPVDLALAEASHLSWVVDTVALPVPAHTLRLLPDRVLVGAANRGFVVARHDLRVTEVALPAGLKELAGTSDGGWTARDALDHGLLLDAAGEVVVDVGVVDRPIHRFDELLEAGGSPPRAWTLTGEEVPRIAPPGLGWQPLGAHLAARHGHGTIDLRDGHTVSGMHTDLLHDDLRAFRDITLSVSDGARVIWSGDESLVGAIGSDGDHLAYRFGDGEVGLRAWRSGQRVIRARAPGHDDGAPITADGPEAIWGIDGGVLWRLSRRESVVDRDAGPRALHVSDRGRLTVHATTERIQGLASSPRFDRIMDFEPADDGWWVIDRAGWVVRVDPRGVETDRWSIGSVLSSASPTSDGGLVVGGTIGVVTRFSSTGEVRWRTAVGGDVFDVLVMPDGRIAASTTSIPLVWLDADGRVTEEVGEGAGYRLTASPSGQVVVATRDGGLIATPGRPPIQLPGPITVAVAWTPTGPVTQVGSDLQFWSPDGRPLRRWRFPHVASAMAVHDGHLFVLAGSALVDLPLSPDAAGG